MKLSGKWLPSGWQYWKMWHIWLDTYDKGCAAIFLLGPIAFIIELEKR